MNSSQSIIIQSSAAVIFEYLIDVNNRKTYIPALEEVIMLDEGPIRKGSKYIEVATIAGRKLETTYQVVEFKKDEFTAAETLKSVFPIRAELNLKEIDDWTRLTITLNFTLKGIFKIASGIVKGIVDQQAQTILEKIKNNIESKNS